MDSPRRQRSISLCQPHSTTPHPSRVGVPTRLPDALGCRPSTAGGQGATLSTFPLVLLTREPTCTQAIDPGDLKVNPHPCGHLTAVPEFRAFFRLPVVRFPMVGPWSTTLGRLVSQSHGAVAWRFRSPCPSLVPFPFASSRNRPVPSVPWTPYPVGQLCGPSHTPFPAPSPCPIIPCLYPTRSPATLWRAHIWLSPKVPGCARLDDYRPIALGQLDMKLLTGPLTQRITEVLTQHGVVSDWQQGALRGSNTGPPLFMAQRQLERGRPNYVFSFDAYKAFNTALHGALHLILRHLSVPPEVIDLLLFLHTCARLRIVTAHGLTQPVHMLRSVRQGKPESPLLYALLLEPLLRAQGHCLRPPGGAEQGLIQAYIDDLLVVAHTLQHFVEGVEAVAAYLGMMGMELNPRKCAMATTEGIPGLQLRLCPHLENSWHWVPAADSVPYLGLQLQPEGEFSLQPSTSYAWRRCTTGASTPSRHRKWCMTSSCRSSGG